MFNYARLKVSFSSRVKLASRSFDQTLMQRVLKPTEHGTLSKVQANECSSTCHKKGTDSIRPSRNRRFVESLIDFNDVFARASATIRDERPDWRKD